MTHNHTTRTLTSQAERFSAVHPVDHSARESFAARLRKAINAAPKIRYPYGREAFETASN